MEVLGCEGDGMGWNGRFMMAVERWVWGEGRKERGREGKIMLRSERGEVRAEGSFWGGDGYIRGAV